MIILKKGSYHTDIWEDKDVYHLFDTNHNIVYETKYPNEIDFILDYNLSLRRGMVFYIEKELSVKEINENIINLVDRILYRRMDKGINKPLEDYIKTELNRINGLLV